MLSILDKAKSMLWPKMGLKRYGTYLRKRTMRLNASPHQIAAGIASGAAVSIFPFIGFHFLLGFVLAFLTRGNMLAAAIGTALGNPLTFPFIFTATYQLGDWLLPGVDKAADATVSNSEMSDLLGQMVSDGIGSLWAPVRTMIVGAIPLSVVTFLGLYFVVRALVSRSRAMRQARLAQRRSLSGRS